MSSMYVSAQECSRNELAWLTELLKQNRDLEVVLSYELPERQQKKDALQSRLNNVLVRLGVKPNLKGYQYLKTAVTLCLEDREELDGITKRLYPSIAKRHKTSVDKVEHAIRHAIGSAWERGCREDQERIFGYHAGEGKRPTNAEFIVGADGIPEGRLDRGRHWLITYLYKCIGQRRAART